MPHAQTQTDATYTCAAVLPEVLHEHIVIFVKITHCATELGQFMCRVLFAYLVRSCGGFCIALKLLTCFFWPRPASAPRRTRGEKSGREAKRDSGGCL